MIFPLCCQGVQVELGVSPKQVHFNKLLLHRSVSPAGCSAGPRANSELPFSFSRWPGARSDQRQGSRPSFCQNSQYLVHCSLLAWGSYGSYKLCSPPAMLCNGQPDALVPCLLVQRAV